MKKLKKYLKGFTLVELIIVITILAILATIAFVSFQNYTKDARDSSRVTTFSNLNNGFEIFFTKVGNYPQPDSPVSYTGGNSTIQMGIVGDNVSKLIGVNTTPKDPLTNQNYIYSLGGNGYYYQIAGEKENTLSSIFTSVYAAGETKLPIVKGNYKMDPSLPSLIPVKTSLTSSGIFDPNVCFIVDGGSNNFASTNGNCVKKKDMSLKTLDSSLVGYWDMETLSGSQIKDLSGNGNEFTLSGLLLPTTTGAYVGKGYNFMGSGLFFTENDMDYKKSKYITVSIISTSGRLDGEQVPILMESSPNANTNSGAFYIIDHYMNICESGKESITTYTRLDVSVPGQTTHGLAKCSQQNSIKNEYKIMNFVFNFYNPEENKMYINGVKIYSNTRNGSHDGRPGAEYMATRYITNNKLYMGSRGLNGLNGLKGIIDDVKIYNRALSDQEIAQQAKIAGF